VQHFAYGQWAGVVDRQRSKRRDNHHRAACQYAHPDALVLSTPELDFGIVSAASPTVTQTITVTNLSASSQTFTSARDGGANTAATFAETASDCASGGAAGIHTLAASSSCHITLGLTASASSANDGPVRTAWKIGTRDVDPYRLCAGCGAEPSATK
jgi:hypothetical protein